VSEIWRRGDCDGVDVGGDWWAADEDVTADAWSEVPPPIAALPDDVDAVADADVEATPDDAEVEANAPAAALPLAVANSERTCCGASATVGAVPVGSLDNLGNLGVLG